MQASTDTAIQRKPNGFDEAGTVAKICSECGSADGLPRTYSLDEVCTAFDLSPAIVTRLIHAGRVGFYTAKRSQQRFLPEHVAQLVAAIEVKPIDDAWSRMGLTERSATLHRRKAMPGGRAMPHVKMPAKGDPCLT